MTGRILCAVLGASAAFGQSFEVASVKPAVNEAGKPIRVAFRGGPGTDDPGRATFENFTMSNLIDVAFSTDYNHVSGPDWMLVQPMFNIAVNVPAGTSKEQFGVMMQNLLRERFHLAYHYEKKEAATYDLVVAKNGPKLRKSPDHRRPLAKCSAAADGAVANNLIPGGILDRTRPMSNKVLSPSSADLERAAEAIRGGGTVVFPTETVYGLGADALDAMAVARISKSKNARVSTRSSSTWRIKPSCPFLLSLSLIRPSCSLGNSGRDRSHWSYPKARWFRTSSLPGFPASVCEYQRTRWPRPCFVRPGFRLQLPAQIPSNS